MAYKPGSREDKYTDLYWDTLIKNGLYSKDGKLYLPTEGSKNEDCRPVE